MITSTAIKIQYTPAISTKIFPFDIRYFADTDINIQLINSAGIISELVLNTDFTVQAVNGNTENGCTVTTTEFYTSGDSLTIYREVPVTQESEFLRGGDIPPEVLNTALDRSVAVSQQTSERSDRTLSCPVSDVDDLNYELPSTEIRKNKAVGFDDDGNATVLDLSATSSLAVDAAKGLNLAFGIISAKVDDTTLEFDSNGKFIIKNSGVGRNQISANAVRTAKILDGNVTFSKIQPIGSRKLIGNLCTVSETPSEISIETSTLGDSGIAIPTDEVVKAYVDSYKIHISYAYWNTKAYFTSAKAIPADNTIPQSDEGSAVMELAFTPNKADSLIKVEVVAYFSNSNGDHCAALFKDAEANAVATSYVNTSSNYVYCHVITWMEEAVNTTERTYKVRVGGSGTTTTFNGDNNDNARYGETIQSCITITEIKV